MKSNNSCILSTIDLKLLAWMDVSWALFVGPSNIPASLTMLPMITAAPMTIYGYPSGLASSSVMLFCVVKAGRDGNLMLKSDVQYILLIVTEFCRISRSYQTTEIKTNTMRRSPKLLRLCTPSFWTIKSKCCCSKVSLWLLNIS